MKEARYRSGPFVWCAILAATCLLLFLFQKILWLVVPFLFGLIIYYLLFPLQQRLVLGGMSRDASAALVSGAAFALAAGVVALMFPWISSHLVSWQDSGGRYIEGGLRFIVETLAWMERSFSLIAKAHLSEQLTHQLSSVGDKLAGSYLADAALTAAAWLPSILLAPFWLFSFYAMAGVSKNFSAARFPTLFLSGRSICLIRLITRPDCIFRD